MRDHEAFDGGIRLGLAAYGVIHLLVAYTAMRLALGDQSTKANSQGALGGLAQSTLGQISLVILGVGFLVLAAWQVVEAYKGHDNDSGARRTVMRISSGVKVVVYLGLAAITVRMAFGQKSSGSTDSLTAQLMTASGGRYLVAAIGLTIIGIGVYLCYYGLTGEFIERLDGDARKEDRHSLIVVLGKVGHVAKGVAFGVVGALFVTAAWQFQPKESGGLDQGLRTLLNEPLGPYLVGGVAIGLVAYGLYCLAWARHHTA